MTPFTGRGPGWVTGGGAVDVSVRQDAPDAVVLGAIDARTARRLIGALRF
ncbi:hypothetical protein ABZ351_05225 [Streptomyces microflavus]